MEGGEIALLQLTGWVGRFSERRLFLKQAVHAKIGQGMRNLVN